MLSDLGPTLAAFLFFNCLFVAGPCTEDHLPWLISTNLFNKMAFSRFKSMFFSIGQQMILELVKAALSCKVRFLPF